MNRFSSMMKELDDRVMAQRVGIPHTEAKRRYRLDRITVGSFAEFKRLIGDFYSHVFATCITNGGRPSREHSEGQAEAILEKEYRRRNSDIVGAYRDAHDGTNGAMDQILTILSEGIKYEAMQLYTRDVFERYVEPTSWQDKVDIIRQFIDAMGDQLDDSIDPETPERYAANFQPLIQSHVEGIRRTSATARRM